jgi:hypothetical protein
MDPIMLPAKTLILLNGPPRVGKTTIANHLRSMMNNGVRMNMADALKTMTHAMYSQPLDPDHFEDVKDIPNPAFGGMTPRQAYIAVSEDFFKRYHGSLVYGELFVKNALKTMPGSCMITADTGFAGEIVPIIHEFKASNIILVRLRRIGATFKGDSRSYVYFDNPLVEPKYNILAEAKRNAAEEIPYRIGPVSNLTDADRIFEVDVENRDGQSMNAAELIMNAYRAHILAHQADLMSVPNQ